MYVTDNAMAAKSSRASENSPSSIPSPTYQWTKSTFGIHKIKFVIKPSPSLGDGRCVRQHAYSTLHLSQITTRNNGGRLVVDANLKTSGTPVNKLDGTLGLDGGNGCIYVFRYYISPIQHTAGHVFAVTGSHFTSWLAGSKQALVISATDSCSW
ncbi:hypothetical protein NQ317_017304 [Molorchus minor]|uniref:Uncharacterized protein n=1 Tax=Molorchus minor TaxID=1323400 RepID=A0ABQ9JWE4_9CUCU|nr:hypothetical protein NQ317_017304 [Molorchus minor]